MGVAGAGGVRLWVATDLSVEVWAFAAEISLVGVEVLHFASAVGYALSLHLVISLKVLLCFGI